MEWQGASIGPVAEDVYPTWASWARHCQPWLAVHLSQLGHALPAQALPDRVSEEGQALPAHGKLYPELCAYSHETKP